MSNTEHFRQADNSHAKEIACLHPRTLHAAYRFRGLAEYKWTSAARRRPNMD